MLKLIPLPAFQDNYLWFLHDGQRALVVDPGDAEPVMASLQREGLQLHAILVTLLGLKVGVIDVPGHTSGHIAYYCEEMGQTGRPPRGNPGVLYT